MFLQMDSSKDFECEERSFFILYKPLEIMMNVF